MKLHPINTAPKDGTEILLFEVQQNEIEGSYQFGEIDIGSWNYVSEGWESNPPGHYCWTSNYGRITEPTHWLPKPELAQTNTDSEYRCVQGHDKCGEMYPGPECPYCEVISQPKENSKQDLINKFIEWFKSGGVDFWNESNAPEELAEIAYEFVQNAADQAQVVIEQLQDEVVFGFYEEEKPIFVQGYRNANELCDPVTADQVQSLSFGTTIVPLNEIMRLSQEAKLTVTANWAAHTNGAVLDNDLLSMIEQATANAVQRTIRFIVLHQLDRKND